MRHLLPLAILAGLATGGAAAAVRGPLASLEPGRWQISRSATGAHAVSQCVRDFAALAQWEHRTRQCRRTVVSQTSSELVVRYTCGGGDFGQAKLTTLTPRSLKIETQGIQSGEPFNTEYFARKSGACARH